jgi:hypothetical protein
MPLGDMAHVRKGTRACFRIQPGIPMGQIVAIAGMQSLTFSAQVFMYVRYSVPGRVCSSV